MNRILGHGLGVACVALLLLTSAANAEDIQQDNFTDGVEWHLADAELQGLSATADMEDGFLLTGNCDCADPGCGDGLGCGDGVDSCCGGGKKNSKPNPCATSHKGLFFANDFSYLNDPCYKGNCVGDCLKQMPLGECGRWGTLDIGGQIRTRYHHEIGMSQSGGQTRFQDTETDFVLTRLRLYTNWQVNDYVRFYTEGILADASDDNGNYIPRGIDRNYGDFLNLFVDLKMTDNTTVRIGRQELLYGVQRLVSPLDWANVRRTFEGVKGMWKDGDLAIDMFYTNFVPVVASEFDEADYDQSFYGAYATCSAWENASLDVYYLGYDNQNAGADFSIHTIGARLNGSVNGWLYEIEGGPQFGRQSGLGRDHSAMFATGGIGRSLSDAGWKPALWCYYDYASGDDGTGNGSFNQFNQLFPLAHKYLGFIDAVQRSNIESPNLLLTMKPSKKVQLLAWYYHFMANQAGTPVPSIGGTAPQSTTSKDLGDELDLIAKYAISARSSALIGYSHFWRGNKINAPKDADFVYVEWHRNF